MHIVSHCAFSDGRFDARVHGAAALGRAARTRHGLGAWGVGAWELRHLISMTPSCTSAHSGLREADFLSGLSMKERECVHVDVCVRM